MDREMTKITKELIENGYSSVRHSNDGEYPDNWFVFAVWKSFEEKNLWLDYDWLQSPGIIWTTQAQGLSAGPSTSELLRIL